MQSIVRTSLLLLVVALSSFTSSHPVFQHHFNNIVNSNPCLKTCMDQATTDNVELSMLKTANITGYLLNLDATCKTISTARQCVSSCGVESNPFALESMNVMCSPAALAEVEAVGQCLLEQGNEVVETCKSQCGDYDDINDQVHQLTKVFKPEANEPTKVAEVMGKINEACGTLKCSNRCATRMLIDQCAPLEGGKSAGMVVKGLIERVLVAQRRDLERMKLVDAMAHSVPTQCSFMYMPEVMFNSTKDDLAMALIEEAQRSERIRVEQKQVVPTIPAGDNEQKKELNLALSQFQAHLLKKQLHLLDMQEKNLIRESQKLDMELQLLARKRVQPNNYYDDGMGKQQFLQ